MIRPYGNLFIALAVFLAGAINCAAAGPASPSPSGETNTGSVLPVLLYHPESDAIVIHNGTRWDNRPLYCNAKLKFVNAGEMPGISGQMGTLTVGFVRGGQALMLDQFSERVSKYRAGRMEWEMTDPKFPGLTVNMLATTLAEGEGFTVRVQCKGVLDADQIAWIYLPVQGQKPTPLSVKDIPGGLNINGLSVSLGVEPIRTVRLEGKLKGDLTNLLSDKNPAPDAGGGLALLVTADNKSPQYFALAYSAKAVDAAQSFQNALARVEALGKQVTVNTPAPYFNAGVSASCAAMYGLFVAPYCVHGGSRWRGAYCGWRVMDGMTAYGWHDVVASAAKYHIARQVKEPNGKLQAAADAYGAEQSKDSLLWGQGSLTSDHYNMQTQFFDQCVRDWRATGDKEFEKMLLPALELHLQWAKRCFDPDDDGLYESYINTWPSDSQWYNGGGSVEESAYNYYQQRAAAEMCLRAGRKEDAAKHNAEADKIRDALNHVLWLKDKGQYAAYIEQGGHKRVHDDAWVYSEHLPIEAGVADPMSAWQAMYYTDWAMEKFRLPYGGEMRQTSNWIPGQWSIRELFHGDNFAMALGYFRSGLGDEGWEMLHGAMLESMYGDPTPKSGYGSERSQSAPRSNIISPGGLSHPNCSIDFNDITSMFCRSVSEGLFGYQPDYPNGIVKIAPAFPSAWDNASIKTPDYSLSFRREGDSDNYDITLKRPAKMSCRLPVRAEQLNEVKVNGRPVEWKIIPWAGYGMAEVEIPSCDKAEVVVSLGKRVKTAPPITINKTVGEQTKISGAIDPQGCLDRNAKPGFHMAFAKVSRGNAPFLQVYKVNISDPAADSLLASKLQQEAPKDAKWTPVDLAGVFNGDIRTIFQQKYVSPRPNTVSCRIGYDGWTAWPFVPWKIRAPEIKLDKVESLLDKDRRLVTPQQAVFHVSADASQKNVAFTSLWDNWPRSVTVPVNQKAGAVWLLICGSTNPMQGRIANAVLTFRYEDGVKESLELKPPENFWSLCRFGNLDYSYPRDGFALPKTPPPQVALGTNCRAMVYGWKLRQGVALQDVTLEALSQEVVIGLMGLSLMN